MKTLYLHIGTPKTATTAIQTFCRDNQAVLNKYGYYFPIFKLSYPNVQKGRNAHFLIGENHLEQKDRDFEREDQMIRECFAHIQTVFEQYDHVILSDESIWNHGFKWENRCWNKIQEELKKNIFSIKVIVYLRRQDDFVYSWWNQVIKEGMHRTSVFTWEEMIKNLPVVQLDYYGNLKKIANIVGKENLIIRKFDRKEFAGQSIQADFLNGIGLKFTEEYQILTEIANTSLSKNCNEIKRVLNSLADLDKNSNNIFRQYLTECSLQRDEEKTCHMFSQQELRDFMKKYEDGNRKIAKEYFGRDESLFEEDYWGKEKWSIENPEMIEDVIRFFGMTTISLIKKNEELKDQVKLLREAMKHPWNTLSKKVKGTWKKG